MKDNLFELLLNLFERSLAKLNKADSAEENLDLLDDDQFSIEKSTLHLKSANESSTRVFTYDEQMKLTKASYQFIMRMKLWNIIDTDSLESIMDQLLFSDSRVVTLQETKWTIRNVLEDFLSVEQLAFLDLVLYKSKDECTIH
jgi:uncharacterized protein Smg (DUF494 family)